MNALPARASRWFERNGAPVGEDENQTPVSLAQARRQGLLPSVHNILSVIARPAIDQSAEELGRTARLCADIQRGAEQVIRGLDLGPEDPLRPWLGFFRDWVAESCLEVRWIGQTAIHQILGYAATLWMLIDCRGCGLTLADLKIQGPVRVTGPSIYRLWGYEMAAWQMALRSHGVTAPFRCLTLVMNSQEPHPPVEAVWSEAHLAQSRRGFLAARQLWVIENGINPHTPIRGRPGARRRGRRSTQRRRRRMRRPSSHELITRRNTRSWRIRILRAAPGSILGCARSAAG